MTNEEHIEYIMACNVLIQQQLSILNELIKILDNRIERLENQTKTNIILSMN